MEVINGYNHNIKYKNDIFHVQTEDSGIEKAHVITHLFYGGNIINSDKNSYADLLKDEDWRPKVVNLMQTMHKNMMKGLIKGAFDDRIASRSAGAGFLNGPAPLNTDAGSQHRSSFGLGAAAPAKPAAAATPVAQAVAPAIPKISVPVNATPIRLDSAAAAPATPLIPSTDPIMPVIPTAAPAAAAPAPAAPRQEYDGTFQVEGNLADLLWEAATTISSEDLENALNSNDDSLLFGSDGQKEEQGLDDMMMSFLGGF